MSPNKSFKRISVEFNISNISKGNKSMKFKIFDVDITRRIKCNNLKCYKIVFSKKIDNFYFITFESKKICLLCICQCKTTISRDTSGLLPIYI